MTLALAPLLSHAFVLPFEWEVGRWASEAVDSVENVLGGDDTQLTIWQRIKEDDKYTRLVKILEVSSVPPPLPPPAAAAGDYVSHR